MKQVTLGDVAGWHWRTPGDHYNGGPTWFGYGYQCVEQPRLYRLEKSWKKTRTTTIELSVDMVKVADMADAVAALNVPPEIKVEERERLEKVPDEWTHRKALPMDDGGVLALFTLSRKGLVESKLIDDGPVGVGAMRKQTVFVRRTDLGRELLG